MRCVFVLGLFAAEAFLVLGVQKCSDVPVPGPIDLPGQGMRWVDTPNCQGCVADACLGCFDSDTSTCARCVYDPISCAKTVGEKECGLLAHGATLRDQTCKGTSLPFADFPYGLCPGNDITELNELEDMTVSEAQNVCAAYVDESLAGTVSDGFCIGFMWTTLPNTATLGAPSSCPKDIPTNGVMWKEAPKCVGCVGPACIGCMTDNTSSCERCVYNVEECYKSSTGKKECDDLIYGANLRGEADCTPTPPHPESKYKITFKSAWHPDKPGTKCLPPVVGAASAVSGPGGSQQSERRKFDTLRRTAVTQVSGSVIPGTNLDTVLDKTCQGCPAFSFCPSAAPLTGKIDVSIGTSQDTVHNGDCTTYTFWDSESEVAHEVTGSFVV